MKYRKAKECPCGEWFKPLIYSFVSLKYSQASSWHRLALHSQFQNPQGPAKETLAGPGHSSTGRLWMQEEGGVLRTGGDSPWRRLEYHPSGGAEAEGGEEV